MLAAKSFGKFKDSFLAEIHAEITSHEQQTASGHVPQPVQGIIVHDSEVLEPEPVRAGGLMRKDAVRYGSQRLRSVTLTIVLSSAAHLQAAREANRTTNSPHVGARTRQIGEREARCCCGRER